MNKRQIKNGLRFVCLSVLCALFLSLSAFAAIPKAEEVRTNGNGVGMFDEIGNTAREGANDVGKAAKDAARGAGDAVGNAARDAGDAVGDAASDAGNAVSDALDGGLDKDNGVISDGHADDGHVDESKADSDRHDSAVSDRVDNTDMGDTANNTRSYSWIWIIVLILAAALVLWLLLAPRKRNGV